MKTTLIVAATLAASLAGADTGTLLSLKTGELSVTQTYELKSWKLNSKIDFALEGFGGLTLSQSKPTGGLTFGPRWKGVQIGAYGSWVQGQLFDGGLYLGFSVK